MVIDYFGNPKQSEEELHKKYFDKRLCMCIEDVLSSNKVYHVIFQEMLDILKYGFEIKEIRTHPIKFRFHKDDKKVYTLEIRHLLSNLIMWKMFMDIDKVELLDESYLFDVMHFSPQYLKKYIDEKLLPIHDGDFASKNAMVDDICHAIVCISHAFCLLMGMSFSIYDVIQTEKRHPEITGLISGDIDQSLSPDEIEHELDERTKRLTQILIEDEVNNDLKPLLVGKNIKPAQFREFIIMIGFKSDINGNTIPVLINSNFLLDGLPKPSSLYINALGGRKSLILTKTRMGEPGAFAKKLSSNATTPGILGTEECCDSVGYIQYFIKDDLFLKLLDGRTYYDQYGTMRILDYQKDKNLIGKLIPFRSPATCTGHDGICQACYGHLFDVNKDLFSVGTLAALKLSEPVGQTVLSSKHQQSTSSAAIGFSDGFDQTFELTSTEVTLRSDSDADADMWIKLGEVFTEEMDDSEAYYITEFDLIDNTTETVYHIKEDHDAKIYLADQLISIYRRMKDKTAMISLEGIDDEESLFVIEIKNKELTEPIKIFQKLLNQNDHMGAHTLSELCQKFAESLIGMGTYYDLVHAECVIRSLVRRKTDITKFPDFTPAGNPNDIELLKLDDALLYNPSPLVSMSFGYLKKQLLGSDLYERNGISHMDPLWVPRLSQYLT